ncbi:MAG: hypothetical protein IPO21_10070 [Bacteroidales bacterium]|nr:hypothetical protein [Bacteroidales bacterium]
MKEKFKKELPILKNGFAEKTETIEIIFQDTISVFQLIDEANKIQIESYESGMKKAKDSTKLSVYDFFKLDFYKNNSPIVKRFKEIDGCNYDSLFDYLHLNGIVSSYYEILIIDDTEPTPKGLSIGATRQDMYRIYGEPIRESENLSIYLCQDEVQKILYGEIVYYEAVFVYFKNNKVFAISIYRPGTC